MASKKLYVTNRKQNNHQITFEEEEEILQNLKLENTLIDKQNDKAKEVGIYGRRISFLLAFYNKTVVQLALAVGYSHTYLHNIIETKTKWYPKNLLRDISFYFEVEESFFTDKKIKIIITEQNKIQYVKH